MMKPLGAGDPAAIASYRLLGVLGGGGMGRVFLGESRTGRRVAIKVIREELAEDPVFRRRFAREVSVARTVNPLFTATVVEADTDAAAPWVATVYIEGPTLSELVSGGGPLASGAVLTLAAGLADALASIHDVGLVHRDIKPSNVIVNDAGPHIIDFGIALVPESTQTTSLLVGTPSYIAPEIIQGSEATSASDVFSLGATLVYAASAKHLVADGSMHAQILQITRGKFDLGPVPRELRPLIVRCISPRPADRPTADELARVLVASGVASPTPGWFSSDEPAPPVRLDEARRTPRPARDGSTGSGRGLSRRTLLVAGGALGIVAVGSAVAVASGAIGETPGAAQATPSPTPPASPNGSPAPPRPGDVRWLARSGVTPANATIGDRPPGLRIIVDRRGSIIGANAGTISAVDEKGAPRWSHTVDAGVVNLRPWGDAILVNDARRLWLLNAENGAELVPGVDIVGAEAGRSGASGLSMDAIVLSPNRIYLGLATATLALDRTLRQLWRVPRPRAGTPVAATDDRLLTHDLVDGTTVQIGLRETRRGDRLWYADYEPGPPLQVGRPPGPGGQGPSGQTGSGPPPPDETWTLAEGALGGEYIAVRDAHEIQVFGRADGRRIWPKASTTPVTALRVVGDLVLVSAGALTAYELSTGVQRWQQGLQGARVGIKADGSVIVAATETAVAALRPNGSTAWRVTAPIPNRPVDAVIVTDDSAYLTYKPTQYSTGPDSDVVALVL